MTLDENPSTPRVSIVVLNWNGLEDTLACMESLGELDYPAFDVLLVDNGSTDGSGGALQSRYASDPKVEILRNRANLGFAEGNNVGIRRGLEKGSDYILILNNDTVVHPQALTALVRVAQTDPKMALLGPKVYYKDDPQRLYSSFDRVSLWWMSALPTTGGQMDRGQFQQIREVDNLVGCALLVRGTAIQDVGLLDPDYFAYYEEVDWSYRMRQKGYKVVFVPDAVIYHKGGASLKRVDPSQIAYYKIRNLILFMKKHARAAHWITFLPILLGLLTYRITRALLRRDTKTAQAILRGVIECLR